MTPSTPLAQRIAGLFRRKLMTPWSVKEVKAYKTLVKANALSIDDVELIERYYKSERLKGDRGIHRRDLQTFLNNFPSELDRARAWQTRFKQPKPKQVNGEKPLSDDEWQPIAYVIKQQLKEFREKGLTPS